MNRLTHRAGLGLALGAAVLVAGTPAAFAEPGPTPTPDESRVDPRAEAKPVDQQFSDEQIRVMAQSTGRSEADQRAVLKRKADQNNAYARVARAHRYDGAYFTGDGVLVVQAQAGSAAANDATAAGLQVRTPRHGEERLTTLTAELARSLGTRYRVVSVAPDVEADQVVVTVQGEVDPGLSQALDAHGDAVVVRTGAANRAQASVSGGDQIINDGGSSCSAGFPAKTSSGRKVMIWAGHCLEGGKTFTTRTGDQIGTFGASAFTSYDGAADRDIGAVLMDSSDTMTTRVNGYGKTVSQADKGPWKAPVGTDLCKSGATSGITCGKVTGYNASVNYSDESGQTVASVSGLATSTVCTAPGDSGGAYVSGGYAVGMTSGGPSGQRCTFNGGVIPGASSYFQPVNDALSYYGLTYGS